MDEPVPVRMSDCRCPNTPHDGEDGRDDGDVALLRPYLDYPGGAESYRLIMEAIRYPEPGPPDAKGEPTFTYPRMTELVGPAYIRHGVLGWNKLDEAGKPVPCTPEALAALRYEDAYTLVDRADDLYGSAVLDPLRQRIATFSQGGRTNGKTRQPRTRSSKRRSQSARSLPPTSGASPQ